MNRKGMTSSIAAVQAARPHLNRFLGDITKSVALFSVILTAVSAAPSFGWKPSYIAHLGGLGYCLFALVSVTFSMGFGICRLFYYLHRDWVQLELPPETAGVNSDGRLAGELVNVVGNLYRGNEHAEVVRLAKVLSRPLWLSGRNEERVRIGTYLEDSAGRLSKQKERILALIDDVGWTNAVIGNFDAAEKNIMKGVELAEKEGDFYLAAKGLRHLGTAALRYKHDPDLAEKYCIEAEHLATKILDVTKHDEMLAGILYNQCEIATDRREYPKAEMLANNALGIYTRLCDEERMIKVKSILARVQMFSGQLDKAKDGFRNALDEAKRLPRPDEIGRSLLGLGEVHLREGDREMAKNAFGEAIDVFDKIVSAKELARAKTLFQIASNDGPLYIPED